MKSVWMLCCALLLAACGQEEVAKAETGQPAPPILALGPHDEVVSLPAQAERPLILNFWSATCAADQMGVTAERYRVNGTPTNYLIGRDGQILEHKAGMLDTADLQRWFSAR